MRIDLVPVSEDLHAFPGKLLLIKKDLSFRDLPDHLPVLIQHVVQTGSHDSDLVLPFQFQPVVRMCDRPVDKLRKPPDRPRQLVIGEKHQDPQKQRRNDCCETEQIYGSPDSFRVPVDGDRRSAPDALLPVSFPVNNIRIPPEIFHPLSRRDRAGTVEREIQRF